MAEQLEERVALLEAEVTRLKHKVDRNVPVRPWWEQIVGTFADNPAYDEAMQLGREYRDSLRPGAAEPSED
jgi:hypothetical protein